MTPSSATKPILVVDDDPEMRAALAASLHRSGHTVLTAAGGEEALSRCGEVPVGMIIADMRMPGMSGLDLFQAVKCRRPLIPFVLMSGYATVESAVVAMKSGIHDYLVKPFSYDALLAAVEQALTNGHPPTPTAQETAPNGAALPPTEYRPKEEVASLTIFTQDPGMLKLLRMAEVVAASQATVLIEGESGTGKELLARLIHERSPRAHRPFVAMNCAAVPEGLLESELFGYEKGAFTGAVVRKPGRFELSHMGTLLLDEISEMHLSLQTKLLRVLQEREVDLLGGKKPIPVDIRVIATTNRPLWEEVKAGRFREDLYYRLNVFPLRLPPLRSRIGDLPFLVNYFIKAASARNRKTIVTTAPDLFPFLMKREWRGNIRELENAVERAVLLAENGVLLAEHFFTEQPEETRPTPTFSSGTTIWEAERNLILKTLEEVGGNRTQTARILGISIRTLRNKLKEYRQQEVPDAGSAL